jgi:hypothetical protein
LVVEVFGPGPPMYREMVVKEACFIHFIDLNDQLQGGEGDISNIEAITWLDVRKFTLVAEWEEVDLEVLEHCRISAGKARRRWTD